LTGCLQEGKHGTYILTELNRPKRPDSSNPSVIEREELAAAEHAYRLASSEEQDLAKLLGRKVHVEGAVTKRSDLGASNNAQGGLRSVGTAGQANEAKAGASDDRQIEESDLAKVEVSSVREVAKACSERGGAKGR
jgi:hypothetical protein